MAALHHLVIVDGGRLFLLALLGPNAALQTWRIY